jgi:hypothetical protein
MAALAFLSGPESTCSGSDTITIGFDVAVLIAAASALATAGCANRAATPLAVSRRRFAGDPRVLPRDRRRRELPGVALVPGQ